jgi:hypothetical protein
MGATKTTCTSPTTYEGKPPTTYEGKPPPHTYEYEGKPPPTTYEGKPPPTTYEGKPPPTLPCQAVVALRSLGSPTSDAAAIGVIFQSDKHLSGYLSLTLRTVDLDPPGALGLKA